MYFQGGAEISFDDMLLLPRHAPGPCAPVADIKVNQVKKAPGGGGARFVN